MKYRGPSLPEAVSLLVAAAQSKSGKGKNLQMPGDPHYQPKDLRPYLGYDQRVAWQILVSWFWMVSLAEAGLMSTADGRLLNRNLLNTMLTKITTSRVRELERKKTGHDVLALLELMRKYLPKVLHRYLHLGLTSYDVVATAYALQFRETFRGVLYPQAQAVDLLWRQRIKQYAKTLQMGRTHLQDALPITAGFWLAGRHSRFVDTVRQAAILAENLLGKFSGAVGTKAAISELARGKDLEGLALKLLDLPAARISTQIVPSEPLERYLGELKLVSGVLAQLGEDVRHLQASSVGELTSVSSTSSTMSHKGANPVAAENMAGMHRSVIGEMVKIMLNGQSDLQRDLRDSNVMRSYAAVLVFVQQQLQTAQRLLKSLKIDEQRCAQNFWVNGKLVPAELLHLSLQLVGYRNAHTFVNKVVVPRARFSGNTLLAEMQLAVRYSRSPKLRRAWQQVPAEVRKVLANADQYLGQAVQVAIDEADNEL